MFKYRITLTAETRRVLERARAVHHEGVIGGSLLKFPGEIFWDPHWLGDPNVTCLNLMAFRTRLRSFALLVRFLDNQDLIPKGGALQALLEDLTTLVVPKGELVGLRRTVASCALPLQAGLVGPEELEPWENLRNVLLGIQRGYTAVLNIQNGLNRTRKRPGWPYQSDYPTTREQFHARVGEILTKYFPE